MSKSDLIPRLVAMFDAALDIPASNVSIGLHCYDGAIVQALRMWAADRGLEARMTTLELEREDGYRWDKYEVCGKWGSIVVHDARSRREKSPRQTESTADEWSPAQHARAS